MTWSTYVVYDVSKVGTVNEMMSQHSPIALIETASCREAAGILREMSASTFDLINQALLYR